jgi:nitrate reductase cytochrome c-type subunit
MSESVQRDDQWSSLPNMVHFRYDDQHPSLPVERLKVTKNLQQCLTFHEIV